MAERAAVNQVVQMGLEVTPGTSVAANRALQSMSFDTHIQASIDQFRPMGYKFPTIDALNREWTQTNTKGVPSYNEIQYALGSIMSTPSTITQIMDGGTPTGAYTWTFAVNSSGPDTPYTFTVEQGDKTAGGGVRAQKFSYAIFKEFGLTFTREKVEQRGQLFAQKFTDNITLTAAPTTLVLVPIVGSHWDVFMDTTSAGLGTTKLGRLFSVNFNFNNKQNPLWVLDTAQASWAAHVETPVTLTATIIIEADATFGTFLTNLRNNNTTMFYRFRATGPNIYTGGVSPNYQATFDMAGKIGAIEPFTDNQGVYAIGLRIDGIHDGVWGKALAATVINTRSAA